MKSAVKAIVTLSMICFAVGVLLAGTNALTAPYIAAAEARAEEEALRAVMPDAVGFTAEELKEGMPSTVTKVYRENGGNGYVFRLDTAGFSQGLRILCAIGNDGRILAVRTVSSNETDGFGKKCESPDYTAQYAGKDETLAGVDAISGATKTTKGYEAAIRDAFTAFSLLTGGDNE